MDARPSTSDLIAALVESGNLQNQAKAGLALERDAVINGRHGGLSWQKIAKALGKNRTTVWEKYHADPRLDKSQQARDNLSPLNGDQSPDDNGNNGQGEDD